MRLRRRDALMIVPGMLTFVVALSRFPGERDVFVWLGLVGGALLTVYGVLAGLVALRRERAQGREHA